MIDGVESVDANHNTGIVTILSNVDLEKSVIEEKIDDIGFVVVKEG